MVCPVSRFVMLFRRGFCESSTLEFFYIQNLWCQTYVLDDVYRPDRAFWILRCLVGRLCCNRHASETPKFIKGVLQIPIEFWNCPKKSKFRLFQFFFRSQKKFSEKYFLTISMQNFIRIPKIILKKTCDQSKDTKNKKYGFFSLFSGFSMIYVHFYVALPLILTGERPGRRRYLALPTLVTGRISETLLYYCD